MRLSFIVYRNVYCFSLSLSRCIQIESVLLVSRQGKTRLAKWYLNASLKEKTRLIRDITSLVLSRPHKQCNFIEFKEKKIIYKR